MALSKNGTGPATINGSIAILTQFSKMSGPQGAAALRNKPLSHYISRLKGFDAPQRKLIQ
jgi:hypothetical protein